MISNRLCMFRTKLSKWRRDVRRAMVKQRVPIEPYVNRTTQQLFSRDVIDTQVFLIDLLSYINIAWNVRWDRLGRHCIPNWRARWRKPEWIRSTPTRRTRPLGTTVGNSYSSLIDKKTVTVKYMSAVGEVNRPEDVCSPRLSSSVRLWPVFCFSQLRGTDVWCRLQTGNKIHAGREPMTCAIEPELAVHLSPPPYVVRRSR